MNKRLNKLLENQASSFHDIITPLSNIKASYWHEIFNSQNISDLVCPSLYLTPTERENLGEYAIIYKIPYINSDKPALYIAGYFSKDTMDSILKENIQFSDSVTYLIDDRDTLVSSTDPILVGRYLIKYERFLNILVIFLAILLKLGDLKRYISLTIGYRGRLGT